MRNLQSMVAGFTLPLLVSAGLSCGTGMSNKAGDPQPRSITLSPSSADAQTYTDGQVPFQATGHYADKSVPQPVRWGVCQNGMSTTAVTVTQTGVAQCTAAAKGVYTVFGYEMTECNVLSACGGGCMIVGTAQLTCP